MEASEYTKSMEYLPEFMRDFHDQKDLFKTIELLYGKSEGYQKHSNGWVNNQIFAIDFFLWFMGQHGYKLQRVRKKGVRFFDLQETIEWKMKEWRGRALEVLLNSEPTDKSSVATMLPNDPNAH